MLAIQHQCPECREFMTERKHNFPHSGRRAEFVGTMLASLLATGMIFTITSAYIFIPEEILGVGGSHILLTLGVILLFGSAITSAFLYFRSYRPRNVKGYDTYSFLLEIPGEYDPEYEYHRHLKLPNMKRMGGCRPRVIVKDQVSGKLRRAELVLGPSTCFTDLMSDRGEELIVNWNGVMVKGQHSSILAIIATGQAPVQLFIKALQEYDPSDETTMPTAMPMPEDPSEVSPDDGTSNNGVREAASK